MQTQLGQQRERALDQFIETFGSAYVQPDDRFVVLFAVGYETSEAASPRAAANLALEMTRNAVLKGSTKWLVYDRITGRVERFSQGEFEDVRRAA